MSASDTDLPLSYEPKAYRDGKLFFFSSVAGPSILISIYILYQFFRHRRHRSRLNNHSIIGLIFISCIQTSSELPITLHYLRLGRVEPMRGEFCLFWSWYNLSLLATNVSLMAWTSIQRHILIFHSNWVQTRSGQWKWNYFPLIFCGTYPALFYFACIIIYRCENNFDYTSPLCGSICYVQVKWLLTFDWITNVLIFSLIIPLASISLLLRVVIQARKMRRSVNWRSTRKMTIQLAMISLLYLIFCDSVAIISLIQVYFIPTFIIEYTYYFLNYAPYVIQLLTPFVCIACLPEMWPRKNQVATVLTAQHRH